MSHIKRIFLVVICIAVFPSLSAGEDLLKLWEKEGGTVKIVEGNEYQQDGDVKKDITERLEELKELKDKGLITKEDYDKKKQEILDEF